MLNNNLRISTKLFPNQLVNIMNCLKLAVAGCIGGFIGNVFFFAIRNRIRPRSDLSLKVSSPEAESSVTIFPADVEPANNDEICHMRQLLAAFYAMRTKDSFVPDVTIECGCRQFKAHREVLIAVNPFFQAALCRGWKEMSLNYVELPSISPDSMEFILGFIYSRTLDTIPQEKNSLMRLLQDSDFLQMDELVKVCFETFSNSYLNTSDLHDMYDFFEELNNSYCNSQISSYLADHFEHFAETKDFLLLKFHQLKNILQILNLNQYSLNNVMTVLLKWTEYETDREVYLEDLLNVFEYWCSECMNAAIKKNMSLSWKCQIFDGLFQFYTNHMHKYKTQENTLLWIARPAGKDRHVFGLYSLNSSSWLIKTQDLPLKLKWGRSIAVFKRHIYFIGCGDEDDPEGSTRVVQYCPLTNTVVSSYEDCLAIPVWFAGAGVLQHYLYIVNGLDINQNCLKTVQCFDTKYGTCRTVASTNHGHQSPCVLPYKTDCFFALGQCGEEDEERFVERYDVQADQWTVVTQVPGFSDTFSAAISNKGLFILKAEELGQFHEYKIGSNEWAVRDFRRKRMFCLGKTVVRRKGKNVLYGIDCKYVHFYDLDSHHWESQSYDHKYRRKIFHFTCV